MYKIAVLGDYDSIYGYTAVGFEIFPVSDALSAEKQLKRLAADYGIIYVTEKVAAEIETTIDRYRSSYLPIIIQIPGVSGNTGAGVNGVKKSVEKAIGSDILFKD